MYQVRGAQGRGGLGLTEYSGHILGGLRLCMRPGDGWEANPLFIGSKSDDNIKSTVFRWPVRAQRFELVISQVAVRLQDFAPHILPRASAD